MISTWITSGQRLNEKSKDGIKWQNVKRKTHTVRDATNSGYTRQGWIKSCPTLLIKTTNGHYYFLLERGRAGKPAKKHSLVSSNKNMHTLGTTALDFDQTLPVVDCRLPLHTPAIIPWKITEKTKRARVCDSHAFSPWGEGPLLWLLWFHSRGGKVG